MNSYYIFKELYSVFYISIFISMILLLLRGRSGSGKDTVANILKEKFGYIRFAFADILKEIVAEKYSCDISILHSQEGKRQLCPQIPHKTWRQVLIDEGKLQRSYNLNVFAEKLVERILTSDISTSHNIVITDWRYPNEFEFLKTSCISLSYDIRTLHIISPNRYPTFDDPSEHMLDSRIHDPVLINPDTVDDLIKQVDSMKSYFI